MGIIGVAVSLYSAFFSWKDRVEIVWVFFVVAICLVIITILIEFLLYSNKDSMIVGSKIRKVILDDGEAKFILSKSKLFNIDTMVSIYYTKNEYDKYVGSGFVENILGTGVIVIIIDNIQENANKEWKEILNEKFDNVVVKPGIPRTRYVEMKNG